MMRLNLFGPTTVEHDGLVLLAADLGGSKLRQILEILALDVGCPVDKDKLAELLWEGAPPPSYVGTLESYVCVLRRLLGFTGGRRSRLATTSRGYVLDADEVSVDLAEFTALTAQQNGASGAALPAMTRAIGLVTGVLLSDEPYAAWAEQARDRNRRDACAAGVRATRLALAAGETAGAVRLARFAVEQDGLSDEAGHTLMRALWLDGRRLDALRAYLDLSDRLRVAFGDEPGPETRELYLAILRTGGDRHERTADGRADLEVLLRLLRQTLDAMPGVRAPATDARLSEVAMTALIPGQRGHNGAVEPNRMMPC